MSTSESTQLRGIDVSSHSRRVAKTTSFAPVNSPVRGHFTIFCRRTASAAAHKKTIKKKRKCGKQKRFPCCRLLTPPSLFSFIPLLQQWGAQISCSSLKEDVSQILPLKTNPDELFQASLLLGFIRRLLCLSELLHHIHLRKLISRRRIVILVQVNLPQEQDVLASHEEDAVRYIGKVAVRIL